MSFDQRGGDLSRIGMPPSALEILENVSASFSGKPLKAALVYTLDARHVRRALAQARSKADEGQIAGVLYSPKNGDALVVLRADDLADLLSHVERAAKR